MRELVSPGSFRWDIRESYAAMAERLRVDEETVRRGVNRARELGFLREVQLILNPHLVGLESTGIQAEVDDAERKPSVVSQVERVEGVVSIINFIGRSFRAHSTTRSSRVPRKQYIKSAPYAIPKTSDCGGGSSLPAT